MDYTSASGYVTDSAGRRQFQDRDIPNGIGGTSLLAKDMNAFQNTLMAAILAFGVAADDGSDDLLAKAIAAAVKVETDRAKTAEGNKAAQSDLTAEVKRAQAAEAQVKTDLQTWVLAQILAGTGLSKARLANGYQTLPGGTILQWGSATSAAGGLTTVSFPIQFPSYCAGLFPVESGASGTWTTGNVTAHGTNGQPSVSSGTVRSMISSTSGTWTLNAGLSFFWFAVGY